MAQNRLKIFRKSMKIRVPADLRFLFDFLFRLVYNFVEKSNFELAMAIPA